MKQTFLLNDLIYIIFAKGLLLKPKSKFIKTETVNQIVDIFKEMIDEKIAYDQLDDDKAYHYKLEMIEKIEKEVNKMNKAQLWEFLSFKYAMFQIFEIAKNNILNDDSGRELLVENEQYLFEFLDHFPDIYYETVVDANEALGSFHLDYITKVLYEKEGYLLGVYDGIATADGLNKFDGSSPYLKYFEISIQDVNTKQQLKPNYVIFGVDKFNLEI